MVLIGVGVIASNLSVAGWVVVGLGGGLIGLSEYGKTHPAREDDDLGR
jgi:hypothetical protein